ncbi:MAG: response regulator, partial [Planctomycetes bacterium]|nr:response regulator [Planctomycetota bacterium]
REAAVATGDGERAARELAASEARYRALAEHSAVGIWHIDAEGKTVYASPAMRELLEVDGEVIDGTFHRFFSSQSLETMAAEHAKRSGGDASRYEVELVSARGTRRNILVCGAPLLAEDGRLEGMIGSFIDLSDRKRLEEQLRQSQKMEAIGQLAGGVAHDFNNLITVISGYGDTHLQTLASTDPRRKGVEQMLKAARRAAALTQQLLAFSRQQVLTPRATDLNTIVEGLGGMLKRLIGEHIELVIEPHPALGRILADPNQIEQVILNLALNARDAMPSGGRLLIETENVELDEIYTRLQPAVRPGSCVMLSITDSGVGMDAETQGRIFEPFFTTKDVGKGTGLGLATVYGIVKQSGGNIWFTSAPGQGTVFKVYFPRVEISDESTGTAAEEPTATRLGNASETILLVEDEVDVRELIAEMLGNEGYQVLVSGNGREALALLGGNPQRIDLVLTDVVMPLMNGPELSEKLQDIRPGMRVLFMSGYMDKVMVKHGVGDPDFLFLEKPFTSAVLLRKVREALDARSKQ